MRILSFFYLFCCFWGTNNMIFAEDGKFDTRKEDIFRKIILMQDNFTSHVKEIKNSYELQTHLIQPFLESQGNDIEGCDVFCTQNILLEDDKKVNISYQVLHSSKDAANAIKYMILRIANTMQPMQTPEKIGLSKNNTAYESFRPQIQQYQYHIFFQCRNVVVSIDVDFCKKNSDDSKELCEQLSKVIVKKIGNTNLPHNTAGCNILLLKTDVSKQ